MESISELTLHNNKNSPIFIVQRMDHFICFHDKKCYVYLSSSVSPPTLKCNFCFRLLHIFIKCCNHATGSQFCTGTDFSLGDGIFRGNSPASHSNLSLTMRALHQVMVIRPQTKVNPNGATQQTP